MAQINNKLLCLFEGKCWHEPHEIYLTNNHMVATTPVQECALCGCRYPEYPSYITNPADQKRLLEFLMGKGEMWEDFYYYVEFKGRNAIGMDMPDILVWLFIPAPDDSNIPRWLLFLQEWLQLEETRERFGMVECPECHGHGTEICSNPDHGFIDGMQGVRDIERLGCPCCGHDEYYRIKNTTCSNCSGTGKVLTEWARVAKEG